MEKPRQRWAWSSGCRTSYNGLLILCSGTTRCSTRKLRTRCLTSGFTQRFSAFTSKTKMKRQRGRPREDEKSGYFDAIKKECVRLYGERNGIRLAQRFWAIRHKTDHIFQIERIRIMRGLA